MAGPRQPRGRRANSSRRALKVPPPEPVSVNPPRPENAAVSLAVAEGAAPTVQTVVYVHGIANKPVASVLKCQWDRALFGVQLGDRSRMAYWVNREYYPVPEEVTCAAGDLTRIEDDEATTQAIMALAGGKPTDELVAVEKEIDALADDTARRQWLRRLAGKMMASGEVDDATLRAAGAVGAKVLPLPAFLRRLITQKLTRAFLRDVNDFFFHKDRRERMTASLVERLDAGGGPFVVIGHSQGSMVAYEVLRHLKRAQCDVPLFVTIGSPLGLEEVKDIFKRWVGGGDRLPVPECVGRWVNVADRLDPVAFDTDISNDFAPAGRVENHNGLGLNPDSPRHPHSGTGYLSTPWVRDAVRETVGNGFIQALGRAVITKDLVTEIEDGLPATRHKTLIQLAADGPTGPHGQLTLAEMGDRLTATIEAMVEASGEPAEAAGIDRMKRFLAADLTRHELERLRTLFPDLPIARVWRNMEKRALIHESTHTVQVRPANLGYAALGRDIGWAVLDTGIRADHPHFKTHGNVVRQWDCTVRGRPALKEPGDPDFDGLDRNGHGTHVAGTIAGAHKVRRAAADGGDGTEIELLGMAPEARLYGFKVLDDRGFGHDSFIIKALDLIADLNDAAGRLVIQGVNLSLGGNFDPSVYGCGHTPLCEELRRLWRQGVPVCLAAGNEGYALIQAAEGAMPANLDLSIGDPANLDEAIAVGSVHKVNPHTYGVSFFSSRGPTADGRRKPDLVAPGEKIVSAYHGWRNGRGDGAAAPDADGLTLADLYVEMSGTSMATPHVSGILAAFLSVRREFVGYPDRVKAILLANCTDLGRDPYAQGAGLPNLVKMLANS